MQVHVDQATAEKLELVHVRGKPKYVYKGAYSIQGPDGRQIDYDAGVRIEFIPINQPRKDEFGEMSYGLPFAGLTANFRARKGCAMGKLPLKQAAVDTGVPANEILEFFISKHSNMLGIEWNIADLDGREVALEDLQKMVLETKKEAEAAKLEAKRQVASAETEWIAKDPDSLRRWCYVCDEQAGDDIGRGWAGHRNKKSHKDAVAARLAEERGEPVAAAAG